MKKNLITLFAVVLILTSTGCVDGNYLTGKYPYQKADYWYCEEIDFSFFYEHHEDGRLESGIYSLNKDGEILTVWIAFTIDNWHIQLYREDGADVSLDDILMSGTWYYKNENLVLIIEKDNLFGGAYEELVFVPTK